MPQDTALRKQATLDKTTDSDGLYAEQVSDFVDLVEQTLR